MIVIPYLALPVYGRMERSHLHQHTLALTAAIKKFVNTKTLTQLIHTLIVDNDGTLRTFRFHIKF